MKAFEIPGSLGGLLAAILSGRRSGECFCGECGEEKESIEAFQARTVNLLESKLAISQKALEIAKDPNRHDKTLVSIDAGSVEIGGSMIHMISAAYGLKDQDEYVVEIHDSRTPETKVFNVHGAEAIEAVISSVRENLIEEAHAAEEAANAKTAESGEVLTPAEKADETK